MALLFSVISRGSTILCNYATRPGNFNEITEQILAKIAPEDGKLTLSHNSYNFHYISENGIIYMCITDDVFERSRAFLFLNEIKRRFISSFGIRVNTAIAYAMNNEFSPVLKSQIKHYTEAKDVDTMSRINSELDELKDIMVQNIDDIASRGENLRLLYEKSENLNATSVTFRTRSRNLQRSLFWKNVKIYIIIFVVCVVVLYLILSMACGGLTLRNC
ncbi:vesicle-associated membrane protein 7 [Cimex lectularius]|uniref:Vesicle-associated membrane protein 7 n=1 Tax=Cimex lectularius TaxID=79782 RepID=A0A8I6S4U7_CIMLE|nr:vesicle-associated membrane protein 7 [Cimex lectularius]XP_014257174.1 vesicle-associated membrane protein 7 [Cimex lectularius]XP_014257175.1 vesicle-associated membrane protein 7 [Cimex lectularius]